MEKRLGGGGGEKEKKKSIGWKMKESGVCFRFVSNVYPFPFDYQIFRAADRTRFNREFLARIRERLFTVDESG